ncbi:alpha/beta fold hydrolase [Phytoactinopolyspora endophytica]|uniref:alpha/beta fold hydrolase n=1 Tax=Phytoactinopolyspora endophytica TaxID=1642495 RepID=UPI00101B9211|nr:alpha/beta fold hydrolase [Phytoactinopolyspora endophytica]
MLTEIDLELNDGRTLHVYDTAAGDDTADDTDSRLAVVWHHGTPNIGEPPEPLMPAAAERGIRWVSYDRPSYGGSSPHPGRDVGSAASDVAEIADALGIERFAVMGHSGGGPHALACAALLPERVLAAVCGSGLAPFDADGLDWYAGIGPAGAAELRAATIGREALEDLLASTEFDPEQFTPADHAALSGPWGWLGMIAGKALEGGLDGMLDDDMAYVSPWGCDPAQIRSPALILHGGQDRMVPSSHGAWLAQHIRSAELWMRPDDGHVSVLSAGEAALDWLLEHARRA